MKHSLIALSLMLAPFVLEDVPKIDEAIKYLLPAVECIVTDDVDKAMNQYNPKKAKKKKVKPEEVQEGEAVNG